MAIKNYISWQDIDKLTKTLVRKIGKTKYDSILAVSYTHLTLPTI